ncbi:MAG: penicillin-binding transpeptidase domain-containing protein, partial [Pseudonocardiaceae bacterium]
SAVVLDPRDGSVLAMASLPTYDPRDFVDGIAAATFRALQDPKSGFPLNNRVIQGQYPPGSTFKLATAMAGLSKGLVTPRDTVDDTGSISIGNPPRVFRNALGKSHGRIDLPQAIAVSSDVYFYRLGQRFWEGRSTFGQTAIQDSARALGLGMASGVELPYEAGGRIPDPEIRKRLNAQNPTAFPTSGWFTGDNVNLAIGQGEMVVTPLQVAVAYATFANGGTVYATRLGRSIRAADGKDIRVIPTRAIRRIDLADSVRAPMLSGFVGAISNSKGTAYGAFAGFPLDRIPVAGKTGTAQAAKSLQDTALFVGFAPVQNPQYVVSVVMEEAGFGSVAAAPVARRILESAFGLGVVPVAPGQGTD